MSKVSPKSYQPSLIYPEIAEILELLLNDDSKVGLEDLAILGKNWGQ